MNTEMTKYKSTDFGQSVLFLFPANPCQRISWTLKRDNWWAHCWTGILGPAGFLLMILQYHKFQSKFLKTYSYLLSAGFKLESLGAYCQLTTLIANAFILTYIASDFYHPYR